MRPIAVGHFLVLTITACGVVRPQISGTPQQSLFADLHLSTLQTMYYGELSPRDDQHGMTAAVLSLGLDRFELGDRPTMTFDTVLSFLESARTREIMDGHSRVFALEGAWLLEDHLAELSRLRHAGVRMVGIAHTFHDAFVVPASPIHPALQASEMQGPSPLRPDSVLSDRGRDLVRALIEHQITVDAAHLPEPAFWQLVVLLHHGPAFVVSHTGMRALCDTPRNLDDAQLRTVAASGGLVGIALHTPLLRCDGAVATATDVARHVMHAVRVMGAEHVALGTDWGGRTHPPIDATNIRDAGALADALRTQGLDEATVARVMWRNVHAWVTRNQP